MKVRKKMRRICVAFLCTAILFSCMQAATAYAAVEGTVTATSLFVRTGPGISYSKVQVDGADVYLMQNTKITIEYKENDWYYTTITFNGKRVSGYVSAQYVETVQAAPTKAPEKTPTPTAAKTPTPAPAKAPQEERTGLKLKAEVAVSTLNVRRAAGTDGALLATLVRGAAVTVTAITYTGSEQWYQISYTADGSAQTGYVYAPYVALLESVPSATPTTPPAPTLTPAAGTPAKPQTPVTGLDIKAVVTANRLNVRKGAGTGNEVTAILINTTKVTVTGYEYVGEDLWYQIRFLINGENRSGYVFAEYISLSEALPTATPAATPTPTAVPPKPTATTAAKTPTPVPSPAGTQRPTEAVPGVDEKDILYRIPAEVSASQLNLREGPSTSYTRLLTLTRGMRLTIISEVIQGGSKWYRVALEAEGSAYNGYVLSDFVRIDYSAGGVRAVILGDKVKLYASASPSSAYVKEDNGNLLVLNTDDEILLLQETTVSEEKWFRVQYETDGETLTGYLPASKLLFAVDEQAPLFTPTPGLTLLPTAFTPTPFTPTPFTPTPFTPTPGLTLLPTPTSTSAFTPTATLTPTPTPFTPTAVLTPTAGLTPFPTETPRSTPAAQALIDAPGIQVGTGYAKHTSSKQMSVKVRPMSGSDVVTLQGDDSKTLLISPSTALLLYGLYSDEDGNLYRHVGVEYRGTMYYGYILEKFVFFQEEDPEITPGGSVGSHGTINPDFELELDAQGFPESYKPALRRLHELYPSWVFKAYQTGLLWDEVIEEEGIAGKNLIPNSKGIEWKSLENGAYNWKTDSFIVYDGSIWVTASKEAIAYYMDPRNFLDEKSVFQFEVLTYEPSYQDIKGVENILKYTPLYSTAYTYLDEYQNPQVITYGETFIRAAEYSGVSPYHLASRVKQEVVTGTSTVSNSVTGTVSGLEGLYNFYNIGAYHSTAAGGAIANGLKYAKYGSTDDALNDMALIPWDNRYDAIVGGAYILGSSYINRGQDTIYLQKFNVTGTSTYYHQYMANVEAPYAEGKKTATAYTDLEELPIVFSIPVYFNMPEEPCPEPSPAYNPNNLLSKLIVDDIDGNSYTVTPSFDALSEQEYNLIVGNSVSVLNIGAVAVSKKAVVSGTGYVALEEGYNEVVVTVMAENGDVREYKIIVIRE